MHSFRDLDSLDLSRKYILVRSDLNVPQRHGAIINITRIQRAAETWRELIKQGCRLIILSHFGRPKGNPDLALSLQPIAKTIENILGQPVHFCQDCIGSKAKTMAAALNDGEVLLLENLRFHPGEESNDPDFARSLADLGDIYVNDAFSVSHRAHASVHALPRFLPAVAGRSLMHELDVLASTLDHTASPRVAVIGGAKITSKIGVLSRLAYHVEHLLIGGAMANNFLHESGCNVQASLREPDQAHLIQEIWSACAKAGTELLIPSDAIAAVGPNGPRCHIATQSLSKGMMILDIGPETQSLFAQRIHTARTLIWNGPLGAFELEGCDRGSLNVARAVAERMASGSMISVAGGGDTLAAIGDAGNAFSYLSSGGGAFLEWLEGKCLPGLDALTMSSQGQ